MRRYNTTNDPDASRVGSTVTCGDNAAPSGRRRPFRPAAWAILLVAGVCGCGKTEVQVPVVPVSGSIKVGKQIPVGAQVVLHAKGHTLPAGVSPSGRVGDDGTFQVSIYGKGEGVPAGDYVATVQWHKFVKGAGGESISGPNVIPEKYGNPNTSPLTVVVRNEPTQIAPILIR